MENYAWCKSDRKSIIHHITFQTTRRMADMKALVADAENYLHVGADANGKIRLDADKFGGFNNSGEMDDSFYQVKSFKDIRKYFCYILQDMFYQTK